MMMMMMMTMMMTMLKMMTVLLSTFSMIGSSKVFSPFVAERGPFSDRHGPFVDRIVPCADSLGPFAAWLAQLWPNASSADPRRPDPRRRTSGDPCVAALAS